MTHKFTQVYNKARDVISSQHYASDWQDFLTITCNIKGLFSSEGFSTSDATALEKIRVKILDEAKKGEFTSNKEGCIIYNAAKNDSSSGLVSDRAAALKMLKHLYHTTTSGAQDVWVYSPPKGYSEWIFDEIKGGEETLKNTLSKNDEIFSLKEREWMSSSLSISLKVASDAVVKLSKNDTGIQNMVKRWFLDDSCGSSELEEATQVLLDGFKKIAVACSSNTLVFTDYATWSDMRHKYFGAAFRGGEGGGFPVIYLEGAFTRLTGNSGKEWLCVETIIHEFSHHEAFTKDHRYDSSGIKPDKGSYPYKKAIENADNWGYFAIDLAGYLSKSDFINVWR